ncbi:16169_t:CDS:1 [Cetraspora pellucida]|uniref:16169_t:CDS:1 n=1 Tax=Cetraspora pellucida TaxID=1433469 RepID=A0ACA9MHN2_9GLOM|nr:16169_t:CDS:1 [Cetraspora pellucida]
MIYSNFDILDKPWWKLPFDEHNNDFLIKQSLYFKQFIKDAINQNDKILWDGYVILHREKYLLECVSIEGNIDYKKLEIILSKSWLFDFLISEKDRHIVRKIRNLNSVIKKIFPSIFFPELSINEFTPKLAINIHKEIGKGIIENVGEYRKKLTMVAEDNFIYMSPGLIEESMNKLFKSTREKFEKEELELEDVVKYGACFFSKFLLIHPFMNGNGWVARILLSYILSKYTIVPLSLYSGVKTRDIYLQCLREAQWYKKSNEPSALARYILECIYKTLYNICVVMDIDIKY